jgi:hypothetical protein
MRPKNTLIPGAFPRLRGKKRERRKRGLIGLRGSISSKGSIGFKNPY